MALPDRRASDLADRSRHRPTAAGRTRIAGIEPSRVRAELEAGKVAQPASGAERGGPEQGEMTTLGRGGSDAAVARRPARPTAAVFTDVGHLHGRPDRAGRPPAVDRRLRGDARVAQQGPRSCRPGPSSSAGVNGVVIES
jgi:hypothetical protein